jgi:hypothetical protein
MGNHLISAATLAGTGIGGATGLAINRLALKNKSILSNLVATGAGSLAGGALGYLADKYYINPDDPVKSTLNDVLAGNLKKGEALNNDEVTKAIYGAIKNNDADAISKLRETFGDGGYLKLKSAVEQADGYEPSTFGRVLKSIAYGGAPGEIMQRAIRWLKTKTANPTEVVISDTHKVSADPKTGLATVTVTDAKGNSKVYPIDGVPNLAKGKTMDLARTAYHMSGVKTSPTIPFTRGLLAPAVANQIKFFNKYLGYHRPLYGAWKHLIKNRALGLAGSGLYYWMSSSADDADQRLVKKFKDIKAQYK